MNATCDGTVARLSCWLIAVAGAARGGEGDESAGGV